VSSERATALWKRKMLENRRLREERVELLTW
jgi:hypothetical protein